ncbi:MAG: hypothetical protein WB445_02985 [Acinetobacter sp.]
MPASQWIQQRLKQAVLNFIPERNACFKRAGSGVDAPPRFIFF